MTRFGTMVLLTQEGLYVRIELAFGTVLPSPET
jgi:hypothetical protein